MFPGKIKRASKSSPSGQNENRCTCGHSRNYNTAWKSSKEKI
jgi:hypothetical protein